MLPHIPPGEYPAWALSLALYLEGGVRSVEIGSVMFGRQPDGTEKAAPMELVRLAFPRRVYTQSHVDYLAEVILHVHGLRDRLRREDDLGDRFLGLRRKSDDGQQREQESGEGWFAHEGKDQEGGRTTDVPTTSPLFNPFASIERNRSLSMRP